MNTVPANSGTYRHPRADQIEVGMVVSVPGAEDSTVRMCNAGGHSPHDGQATAVIVVDRVEVSGTPPHADIRLIGRRPDGTSVDLWVWGPSHTRVYTDHAAKALLAEWGLRPEDAGRLSLADAHRAAHRVATCCHSDHRAGIVWPLDVESLFDVGSLFADDDTTGGAS